MDIPEQLHSLVGFLRRVPAIGGGEQVTMGGGIEEGGLWWVKFEIDIGHPLAWHVVQELGYVLNYLSTDERLPTVFMPVSPPPYMNGGPQDYLSWLIESRHTSFTADLCMKWLEGRMPRPVDDLSSWKL